MTSTEENGQANGPSPPPSIREPTPTNSVHGGSDDEPVAFDLVEQANFLKKPDTQSKLEGLKKLQGVDLTGELGFQFITDVGMGNLIPLGDSPDMQTQLRLTQLMTDLAKYDRSRIPLFNNGGIELLIRFMNDAEPPVKVKALHVLCRLCLNAKLKSELPKRGVLGPLIRLGKQRWDVSGHLGEDMVYLIGVALTNLSGTDENVDALLQHGVLKPLMHMLLAPSPKIQKQASQALSNLAIKEDVEQRLLSEGLLRPSFVHIIRLMIPSLTSGVTEEESDAIREIAAMALLDSHRREFNTVDAVACVSPLTRSPDPNLRTLGVETLQLLLTQKKKDDLAASGVEPLDEFFVPMVHIGSRHLEKLGLRVDELHDFLHSPPARGYFVQCRVELSTNDYVNFYLDDNEVLKFAMCALKKKKSKSLNFAISTNHCDMRRKSQYYVGKLRANYFQTEYYVYDKGENPKRMKGSVDPTQVRQELGAILWSKDAKTPNRMTVVLPGRNDNGQRVIYQGRGKGHFALLETWRKSGKKSNNEVMALLSKDGKEDKETGMRALNFSGRVRLPSDKNFQLISDQNDRDIIMQFGQVGQDTFTLDYQSPLSALQAFAIALSVLAGGGGKRPIVAPTDQVVDEPSQSGIHMGLPAIV
eukprot:TRINITY_DN14702_c0_g1::TRINITY_DN14702_c0_g1_i1::g.21503::m.21503 TRINITY_DN14702_c0_g1::TRINITY_DN14702_c0_g1_i1::g.21503  ORF type:complete len:643 (+),score=88.35,sp/O88413/TULP3_MOUSE/38.98/6e-46,Tub/PF01167.13/4.1e-48,Arm/PF00514.18/8.3,Arm/PF00514.18/1.7e-09,HEAT_2/PF13646.1/8.3,HEAT_2/PF13646.1/0.02,HEAT_2/PF13646.1/0.61,HEAT/PF02985.17/5.3,HEAT/PF02985.17/4.5,HEAT/PF02985.17/5.8e+02,HEAT/PF02985.17/3.1e+03,DUF3527/PF12043.3/1.3e+03,DUF3527/PF12043.3/0.00092,V-ATPase_H_N/PF03224.9/4.4e+02